MRYAVTAAQKVVLSLLISLVLFTVVTVLAVTGLSGLNKMLFAFPTAMNMLLFLSIFFTIFLSVFFCFNLRQDPVTIILYRLQSLRKSLMEQFYEQKGEMDWARWTMELEQRREGVHAEIKRGIKWGRGRYSEADIDSFIDTSWDELLELIGAWGKTGGGIDEEKLRDILTRVLQTLPPASATGVPAETSDSPETLKADETAEEFTNIGNIASLRIGGIGKTEESSRDDGKTRRLSATHAQSGKRPFSKRALAKHADEGSPETRPKAGGLLAAAVQKRTANPAAGRKAPPVKAPDAKDPIEIAEELEELEEIQEVKEMKKEMKGKTEKLEELAQAEELEELEEVEEIEDDDEVGELEELEESPRTKSPSPKSPRPMNGIKELESAIEFSDNVSGEKEAEEPAFTEVEIVSPFSSMFSSPETETILQEDGVPRINSGVLSPDQKTEAGLDKDFKNLVDTVVKR